MKRTGLALLIAVLAGVAAGAAVTAWYLGQESTPEPVVRDLVARPSMTEALAEQHREDNYQAIESVEDVLELPTSFARSEAMYALAGRSNAAAVQSQVFSANRIADDVEREQLLNILFLRLAEIDPESALALARTEYFANERTIEFTIWSGWARKDFEGALFAAKTQPNSLYRNIAAQGLFAAFGGMGNETTKRIEAELGIRPDRSQRANYLFRIAAESPEKAAEYVNAMPAGNEKIWNTNWLANYLTLHDAAGAMAYAAHFEDPHYRQVFENVISTEIARANPHVVVEEFLASRSYQDRTGALHHALQALADEDPDALAAYYQSASSRAARQTLGFTYVNTLAANNPHEAIRWARENEGTDLGYGGIMVAALTRIALTDPELALTEALRTGSGNQRRNLVANVAGHIAQLDPQNALAMVDRVDDRSIRDEARQSILNTWVAQDPDRAVRWLESLSDDEIRETIEHSGFGLAHHDPEVAIRLLPYVSDQMQPMWRHQIAQQLSSTGSIEEAMHFVRRFEGQPGFPELQAIVITRVAYEDPAAAQALADQMPDPESRDAAYVQVVEQVGNTDPAKGVQLLASISDPSQRGAAGGRLFFHWYSLESEGALAWLRSMPPGPVRDQTVRHGVTAMDLMTEQEAVEFSRYIDQIEDRELRIPAKVSRIYYAMGADPARVPELMSDPDIPDDMRNQLEAAFRHQYQ